MKTTVKIDNKYFPALSRIFTPIVIENITKKNNSSYLAEVCKNCGLVEQLDLKMPLGQFFDWVYDFLFYNYRNEYIYKNTIANKILLGRHSLQTSHMLTEFRVGKCKADAVIINGTSNAYEIKSEFDSFSRLEKQILTYMQIFDHVNVITSNSQANKLNTILPEKIGILVLTDRNTISTIRKSKSNKKNINQNILFDSLRKNEYLEVILNYYGYIPDVQNTRIYKECKKLFSKITPEIAHELAIKVLKKRSNNNALNNFINNAPASLSAYAMSISEEKKKLQALIPRFSLNLESLFVK